MILLIDNFDSFTFNLVQVLQKEGADPVVLRNNNESLFEAVESRPEAVIISPGPGRPDNAGLCLELLNRLDPEIPVLGVCLGHQILGQFGGGRVRVAQKIMHGKTSMVQHQGEKLFNNLPSPLEVCRYHSLLVDPGSRPMFRINARTAEDEVMGLEYADRPWVGVQFHPESILTPHGPEMIRNFLRMAGIDSG